MTNITLYCDNCGAKLHYESQRHLKCPACGAEYRRNQDSEWEKIN